MTKPKRKRGIAGNSNRWRSPKQAQARQRQMNARRERNIGATEKAKAEQDGRDGLNTTGSRGNG